MELKWVEDFLCLCETRSFRSAADQRCVSQPAFSRRIRALESWIGVDLVDRSSYPAQLTTSGEEFVDTARQLVEVAYQARDDLRSSAQQGTRMVTIATHPSLAVRFVPDFLRRFRGTSGRLGCRIRNDLKTAEFYLTALEHGSCDFLICYHHEALTFVVDEVRFPSRAIGREVLVPVASSELAGVESEGSIPLLRYAPYTRLGKIVEYATRKARSTRSFDTAGEASVAETLKAMVLAGHGVAWLPRLILIRELAEGSVVPCPGLEAIPIEVRMYRHEAPRQQAEWLWQQLEDREDADPESMPAAG